MKKLLPLLLAVMILCSACSSGTPASTSAPETPDPTAAPEPALSTAEDTGFADQSNLPFVEALSSYKKTDWTAEWIWTQYSPADTYVAFRKSFSVEAEQTATAWISAESKYTLFLNGELLVLDGSFKRGPTPVDCYYDTVSLDLKKGENTLAVVVNFNGRGAYSSTTPLVIDELGEESAQGGFLFEMNVDGTVVKSDASWKTLRLPMYKNATSYKTFTLSAMLAERNVIYVAADDIGDFTEPSFDDSSWENATPVAKAGQLPFGSLYDPLLVPPVPVETVDFDNAPEFLGKAFHPGDVLSLDLSGNIQFNPYFELTAAQGVTLTYYTDSTVFLNEQGANSFKDIYVTKSGDQSYLQLVWRSGSKLYIEISGDGENAEVTFNRLAYMPTGLNGEIIGSFQSDNDRLNTLWNKSLNTVKLCVRDNPMDCPDRERSIYAGDVSNEGSVLLYAYDESGMLMVKKMLLSYMGWIRDNYVIPSQAPSTTNKELPVQSLSLFDLAYQYWLFSGDETAMRAWYQAGLSYLMLWEMKDGLPVHREGDWDWSDWGDFVDHDAVQAGYYYYALRLQKQLGEELGITDGIEELSSRMEQMKASYRAAYYTDEGFKSASARKVDERANAIFALSGLAEESDYELIARVISTTSYASPYFERFVEKALGEMGRDDLLIGRMLTKYGEMIDYEIDTLWEMFVKGEGTYNHGWAAGPLYAMNRYLVGIYSTSAGWASYTVEPTTELESFTCTVWTPKGIITVTKDGSNITVDAVDGGMLVLPDGSTMPLESGEHTYVLS